MKDWDSLYQGRGIVQQEPSPRVLEAIAFFRSERAIRVLDLGCGTGRHTTYLARQGFEVYGCDSSAYGLRFVRAAEPQVQLCRCDMGALPYRDEVFDGVLSHAVVQHGIVATVRRAIAEIRRVLRRGGVVFFTVPSTEHPEYLTGEEIEPNTKMNISAIDGDMPHHYFTEAEMMSFFEEYTILGLEHHRAPSEKTPSIIAATWALYAKRP